MRAAFAVVASTLLCLSIPASAHLFNHQTRHEDCQVYEDPHGHSLTDGHVHYHHLTPAASAHYHGTTLYAAGHTHTDVLHDPCDQVGMKTAGFPDMPAIEEVSIVDAATGNIPAGLSAIIIHDPSADPDTPADGIDEAYAFPVSGFTEVQDLILHGDGALAGAGFPGAGTPANPYIIEGYLVRNVLDIKDTSACVVVRYNVIQSNSLSAPLLDLDDVADNAAILADAQTALALAQADLAAIQAQAADLAAQLAGFDDVSAALEAERDAALGVRDAANAALDQAREDLAEAQADDLARQAQIAQLQRDVDAFAESIEALQAQRDMLEQEAPTVAQAVRDAHDALAQAAEALDAAIQDLTTFDAQQQPDDEPATVPSIPDVSTSGLSGLVAALLQVAQVTLEIAQDQDLQAEAQRQALVDAVADAQADLATAQDHAATLEDDATTLADDLVDVVRTLDASQAGMALALAQMVPLQAQGPDFATLQAAVHAAEEVLEFAEHSLAQAIEAVETQEASELPLVEAHEDTLAAMAVVVDDIQVLESDVAAATQALAFGAFTFDGIVFDSMQDVVDHVLDGAEDVLDPNDAGRLILDWNGQCVHAYNNVVGDLRVNRNNVRTGYATGGVIEENRIGVVGQIRHFDGEFRENEVGDRTHVLMFGQEAAPLSELAINADGFNEAVMRDNLVYGHVDLDLHGHHHGPGFFARESHYHGSDDAVGYMRYANGTFMLDANGQMIPHHDHAKRWTSATFAGNLVIDPLGYGVRYEDRDHAGDDRTANSEDMRELLKPHFHRTFVTLEENDVVGSIWVDIFNADGIEVWSDDLSPVRHDLVTNEVLDAILHLGAERINTHSGVNTGWLDVVDNEVFTVDKDSGAGGYAWSPLQFNDMKEVMGQILDNTGFFVPRLPQTGMDAQALVAYLRDARNHPATQIAADVQNWGEDDAMGPPSIGLLLRGIKDSTLDVCGNTLLGFDEGMQATVDVYTSTTLNDCGTNDYGGAASQADLQPEPAPAYRVTQPVRDVLQGSVLGPVADPVLDEVDPAGAALEAAAAGTPAEPALDAIDDAADALPDGPTVPLEHQVGATLEGVADAMDQTPAAPVSNTVRDVGVRLQ